MCAIYPARKYFICLTSCCQIIKLRNQTIPLDQIGKDGILLTLPISQDPVIQVIQDPVIHHMLYAKEFCLMYTTFSFSGISIFTKAPN